MSGFLSAGPVLRGDPTEVTCSEEPEYFRVGPVRGSG